MPPHARRDIIVVAALAIAANFAYLYFSNADYFFPDSATYLGPAYNMLRGDGFITSPGTPEFFRTPGYPLFLLPFLAVTASVVPILLTQHLLNAALSIAVYFFARRFSGSRAAGLTAGIIFALDLPTIHLANKVLTETLFTSMLFALWALVMRTRRTGATTGALLLAGVLAGGLVLVRPVAILYFAVPALFLFWTAGRRAAVFVLVALVIPIGWGLRNRVESGVFTMSTVAGTNMLLHRAAPAISIWDDGDFRQDLAASQAQLLEDAQDEIVEKEDVASIAQVNGARLGKYYGAIGRRIALQHPAGLTLVVLRGLFINLFDSDWEAVMVVSKVPSTVIEIAMNAVGPFVIALAAIGVLALRRRDALSGTLLAATVVYFVVLSAGSEAEARFRVPVMPQIAIAAGIGVEAIRRGIRDMGHAA
jgi:hypothetical protein